MSPEPIRAFCFLRPGPFPGTIFSVVVSQGFTYKLKLDASMLVDVL